MKWQICLWSKGHSDYNDSTGQVSSSRVQCPESHSVQTDRQTHNTSTRAGTEQPITVDRRQDRDAVTHNTSAALLTALQGRTTSQPKNISLRNVHLRRTHHLMRRACIKYLKTPFSIVQSCQGLLFSRVWWRRHALWKRNENNQGKAKYNKSRYIKMNNIEIRSYQMLI